MRWGTWETKRRSVTTINRRPRVQQRTPGCTMGASIALFSHHCSLPAARSPLSMYPLAVQSPARGTVDNSIQVTNLTWIRSSHLARAFSLACACRSVKLGSIAVPAASALHRTALRLHRSRRYFFMIKTKKKAI